MNHCEEFDRLKMCYRLVQMLAYMLGQLLNISRWKVIILCYLVHHWSISVFTSSFLFTHWFCKSVVKIASWCKNVQHSKYIIVKKWIGKVRPNLLHKCLFHVSHSLVGGEIILSEWIQNNSQLTKEQLDTRGSQARKVGNHWSKG